LGTHGWTTRCPEPVCVYDKPREPFSFPPRPSLVYLTYPAPSGSSHFILHSNQSVSSLSSPAHIPRTAHARSSRASQIPAPRLGIPSFLATYLPPAPVIHTYILRGRGSCRVSSYTIPLSAQPAHEICHWSFLASAPTHLLILCMPTHSFSTGPVDLLVFDKPPMQAARHCVLCLQDPTQLTPSLGFSLFDLCLPRVNCRDDAERA